MVGVTLHPSIIAMIPSIFQNNNPADSCSISTSLVPPITGLLFAAGWCPDCTDVVPAVGAIAAAEQDDNNNIIQFIYVGSDYDEESLIQFKPSSIRHHIPIAAEHERSDIKRKFNTCAAKEMTQLGITHRKHGIPTLILLDSASGAILSEDGIDHVVTTKGSPTATLEYWKGLLLSGSG